MQFLYWNGNEISTVVYTLTSCSVESGISLIIKLIHLII